MTFMENRALSDEHDLSQPKFYIHLLFSHNACYVLCLPHCWFYPLNNISKCGFYFQETKAYYHHKSINDRKIYCSSLYWTQIETYKKYTSWKTCRNVGIKVCMVTSRKRVNIYGMLCLVIFSILNTALLLCPNIVSRPFFAKWYYFVWHHCHSLVTVGSLDAGLLMKCTSIELSQNHYYINIISFQEVYTKKNVTHAIFTMLTWQ